VEDSFDESTKMVIKEFGISDNYFASKIQVGDKTLVLSVDGVGSKIYHLSKHNGVHKFAGFVMGHDCAVMNINDVLCTGATPKYLTDHITFSKQHEYFLPDIINGLKTICDECNIEVVAGETEVLAEELNALHLSANCIGVFEDDDEELDGSKVNDGDFIYGIPSNGFHCNGYTIISKYLNDEFQLHGFALRITKCYYEEVKKLKGKNISKLIHITGGGFDNILRGKDVNKEYILDNFPSYEDTAFEQLQQKSGMDDRDMFLNFNMGIGFVVISPEKLDLMRIGYVKNNDNLFDGKQKRWYVPNVAND
jgi:phosphoribosylformylglycinamidine cyclo-ligase